MTSRMRPGRVAQIRLNPKDCMTVVDIVNQAGGIKPSMSFAQAVSLALGCAFETFRKKGVVPDRDGFEFNDMMQPFPDTTRGRRAEQYCIAQKWDQQGSGLVRPTIDVPSPSPDMGSEPAPMTEAQLLHHPNHEVRTTYIRLKELTFKRSADVSSFSDEDALELDGLENKLGHLL